MGPPSEKGGIVEGPAGHPMWGHASMGPPSEKGGIIVPLRVCCFLTF